MLINISIAPHNYQKWKVKNYYRYIKNEFGTQQLPTSLECYK